MIACDLEKTYIKREFCSTNTLSCPICEGFSNVFSQISEMNENQFKIPSEWGFGGSKRITLGNSIEVCFNDMKLNRDTELSGRTQGDAYVLMFCLGEEMSWQETNTKQMITLKNSCGIISHVSDVKEMGFYEKNRHYQGVTISLHPNRFSNAFQDREKSVFPNKFANYEYAPFLLSPDARIIIAEMLHCGYKGRTKSLLLEGKVLELLASSIDTFTGQDNQKVGPRLSRTDRESISKAKEILDASLSQTVTIAALARKVCLNESKLKSGFKHIYGKPVYTYLLDMRLETARILLETQHISVTQVADFVGYESGSSFSKAFHKRFGFYPSECALSTRFKKN